jgi:CBS domain-containing protein
MHRGVIACVVVLDDLRTFRPIGVFSVLDVADALREEGDR